MLSLCMTKTTDKKLQLKGNLEQRMFRGKRKGKKPQNDHYMKVMIKERRNQTIEKNLMKSKLFAYKITAG